MGIYSMTGFGRAALAFEGRLYTAEAKSVNHKYLDTRIKLPRALSFGEPTVKACLVKFLKRGRVELTVQAVGVAEGNVPDLNIDYGAAESVVLAHRELAERLDVTFACTTRDVFNYPGVLRAGAETYADADVNQFLGLLVEPAIEALNTMRRHEGSQLHLLVVEHLKSLSRSVESLASRAPEMQHRYRERLTNRMSEALGDLQYPVDEARILHEVALFSERVDVAEEIGRLRAHLSHFEGLLSVDGAVGRKMDFLCQEILRETNTVGSKAQDLGVTETVVNMKAELERLREQIQNVE